MHCERRASPAEQPDRPNPTIGFAAWSRAAKVRNAFRLAVRGQHIGDGLAGQQALAIGRKRSLSLERERPCRILPPAVDTQAGERP